jgi:hypothetical protein
MQYQATNPQTFGQNTASTQPQQAQQMKAPLGANYNPVGQQDSANMHGVAPSSYAQQPPAVQQQQTQQYYQQQYQNPQSVEQSVNNNNAQSVQNFMSALNKVGAGNNNNFMNAQGQQGIGPQNGFRGFGINGLPSQYQPMQYNLGPIQNQIGYQQNGSYQNNNNYAFNQANQGQVGYQQGQQFNPTQIDNGAHPAIQQGSAEGMLKNMAQGFYGAGQNVNPNAPGAWSNNISNANNAAFGNMGPNFFGNANNSTNVSNNIGALGAFSDENAKTKIVTQSTDKSELQEFLNSLNAYSYEYKDEYKDMAGDHGRRISPMAQEIESTKLGKKAVFENAQGIKAVDYGKLAGTQLAATAFLNHKLNSLENKLNKVVLDKIKASKGK